MENFPPNFVVGFVQLHNQYRVIHGVPPIEIDQELSDYAQEWADVLAGKGDPDYRPEMEYGENIYISTWKSTDREIKPSDPLESWYREGRYFKYGQEQPQNLEDVCHFTQLIWKESKSIGLGMANSSDERVYFVCIYDPPGNVEGEFAENVLPPKEDGHELLPHEAEGIRITKTRPSVVRSMERLYAVPSEKLRVWSIWLTKIGEIADVWQRWLRAHIDFVMRLSDHLYAAEMSVKRSKMEIVQLKKATSDVETEWLDETDDSTRGEHEGSIYEEASDMTAVEETSGTIVSPEQGTSRHKLDKLSETGGTGLPAKSSTLLTSSTVTVKTTPSRLTTASKSSAKVASKTSVTPGDKTDEKSMSWPIGRPWEPSGWEDVRDEEEFEKLPLPRNEQQMRKFLKKFTHEATVYRSYYKHWKETAEQATKQIGGRLVLATFVVQGKDETGRIKMPISPRRFSNKVDRKVRAVSSVREPVESNEEKLNASASNPEATVDKSSSGISRPGNPSSENVRERSQVRLDKESQKSVEVPDWVRDCARALEPIPYAFYVKAEPDIGIAVEYDDEEVIPADLDRETVVADRKRIFFNLTDKPCTGGKPWI